MKYALFDEKGLPLAFYDTKIHTKIPKDAIEISDKVWRKLLTGKYAYIDGELIDISDKVWDDKKWRAKTKEEKLQEYKETQIKELNQKTKAYIESFYPDIKQRSDIADKEYWGTYLLSINQNYSLDEIYKTASKYALDIFNKKIKLSDILNKFSETERKAWEQLIKVALRILFVQECKSVYHEILNKIQKATSIEEIDQLISLIKFPKFPEL